jgi:hypothetical protein
MTIKHIIFVTVAVCFCTVSQAQRNTGYDNYNRIGIQGGLSIFDIKTNDLITESRTGVTGGFTTRGAFRNNFDFIYGLNFLSNQIRVRGVNSLPTGGVLDTQLIDYTIIGAQINFLLSYNIVKKHLSIEAGPMLNVNSKMELKNEQFENYIIEGYTTITAKNVEDISTFNGVGYVGVTAGLESFRIIVNYQYGFTNILGNLNKKNLENKNFKGNSSTATVAAVIYF